MNENKIKAGMYPAFILNWLRLLTLLASVMPRTLRNSTIVLFP
jgi:hypothetical protein